MQAGVLLPDRPGESAAAFASRAESIGYDAVWVGELWGEHAFVQLTRAADHTEHVALGTAIVNVFSRSPAVLAMAAASLSRVAGDRVRLGVGASTPTAIESLHGLPYERPLRRSHETIELVQALTGDEPVTYDGEIFQVEGVPPVSADVPVYNAALGPRNRRLTGRVADGWLPHNIPFPGLADAFETVADEARDAGRDPERIVVSPYVPSAVSDDPDEARDAVRGHVAYYVGSGAGYRNAVAAEFPDEAERVSAAWNDGDRAGARERVTDEMVDALGVAGTPEEARERFREVASLPVVDEPIVVVPAQTDEAMTRRTVEELAPDRL